MTTDPRLVALSARTSCLADLLDTLWQAATNDRLKESVIAMAAQYALQTHDQLQAMIDEGGDA